MRPLIIASLFALTACGQPIKVNAPAPPAEWLSCQPAPETPTLAPLAPVAGTYAKPDVDARDSVIARYLLALRAAHFDCENALAKVRGYYGG